MRNKRNGSSSRVGPVFITDQGHALVCASRVVGAEQLWVEFQDGRFEVDVIGHDRMTNIAVLKLKKLPTHLIGSRSPRVSVCLNLAHVAFAITCPLDLDPSPVLGLFSGVDKYLWNHVFPTDCIRTSISANARDRGDAQSLI